MPEFVFISCGCSNESPQTKWLKTKHVYSCTVPEVRSPESVALDKVTALAGPCSLSLEAGDSPLLAPPHSVPQPASPRITCSSDSCHPCSFRLFLACSGRFLLDDSYQWSHAMRSLCSWLLLLSMMFSSKYHVMAE